MSSRRWHALSLDPERLIEARLQAHWGAQVVASVAFTHIEPKADDSHTNLEWLEDFGCLAGHEVSGESGFRAALRVSTLELLILSQTGPESAFQLLGSRLNDAYGWMADQVARAKSADSVELKKHTYEIPSHGVARDQVFDADPRALEELARWFSDSDLLLREVEQSESGASPVRCWPHHFDIATLISLDPKAQDQESARFVGVGMTPGDDSYPEPYFYVNPWPRPENSKRDDLPELPAGSWHLEGWFGAVLTASELVSQPRDLQGKTVRDFLKGAVRADYTILGYET